MNYKAPTQDRIFNGLENNIFVKALKILTETTGLRINTTTLGTEDIELANIDGLGNIDIDGIKHEIGFVVKNKLTKATLGATTHQATRYTNAQAMILTDHVTPQIAEQLKEMGIWFADTAGNAYINAHPVFVYIKGNKAPQKHKAPLKARAFQTTGLKAVFALLQKPNLVNAPYRDIAQTADVALGTVGKVVTDLKELGYILEMGKKGRRLTNRKQLLDRWVAAYPEQLRPKLVIGQFTAPQNHVYLDNLKEKYGCYWGGEVAAERITKYLRPELTTIYVRDNTAKIQLALKLRKDPRGKIELLKAFWDTEYDYPKDNDVAPLILVYADLLATGDPRNIETAQLIYEHEITRFIGED